MLYVIAVVLSAVVCVQAVASGLASGNITHLKYGREPNAHVSLFPMIPLFQLLALGIAWLLEQVMPSFAIGVLFVLFLVLLAFWLVSFKRLRSELRHAMSAAGRGAPN